MGGEVDTEERELLRFAERFRPLPALEFVHALTAERFGGRSVGSRGHDAARDLIAARLGDDGWLVVVEPVEIGQVPVFDAVPLFEVLADGPDGAPRGLRYRVDFAEHPRSAFAPDPVHGVVRRGGRPGPGDWVVAESLPAGDGLGQLARLAAEAGAAGLLTPQNADSTGFLNKRLIGGPTLAVPAISVRPDVLDDIGGRPVRASMPLRRTTTTGANVLGAAGSGPADALPPVLVTAHYDGVGDDVDGRHFPAAGDNATGVAVVLEVARIVAAARDRLRRPVMVALVDGEELGAQGSRAHARRLAASGETALVLNVDMAGQWHGVVAAELGPGSDEIRDALDSAGRALHLPLTVAPVASDNRSYAAAGLPAVGIGFGAAHYHSPLDAPDQVDPRAVELAGRLVLGVVWHLAAELPAASTGGVAT